VSVPGRLHELLAKDHRRLEGLLARATASPSEIDAAAFGEFRRGLLRHVAMEEKVLFPSLRRAASAPLVEQLHRDHLALSVLLVPPPSPETLAAIRRLLELHDPLEEDPGGLYERAESAAGPALADLVARLEAVPPVRAAAYSDGPRVRRRIEESLRSALENRSCEGPRAV
jgi:hypothetical protein